MSLNQNFASDECVNFVFTVMTFCAVLFTVTYRRSATYSLSTSRRIGPVTQTGWIIWELSSVR